MVSPSATTDVLKVEFRKATIVAFRETTFQLSTTLGTLPKMAIEYSFEIESDLKNEDVQELLLKHSSVQPELTNDGFLILDGLVCACYKSTQRYNRKLCSVRN